MNIFYYTFRAVYRIKWWLLFLPLVLTAIVVYKTRDMDRQYETSMAIYTGVISGYGSDAGETNAAQDWNVLNNSLQNIINTMTSQETLKRLALHLYARCMINGNAQSDNLFISAKHYKELLAITPKSILALIDKKSEENTVANLQKVEKADRNNFVYGLLNWNHPYFSSKILREKIKIKRIDNSDILSISYQANDAGIAFQTLEILSQIYPDEYEQLQFGKTNNVIKYFEAELARVGKELRGQEDSLTDYNVANRVINYDKQTEAITILDREYELRSQEVLMAYSSAQSAIQQLEEGMDANMRTIKNNSEFLNRMQQISDLNYKLSKLKTVSVDSIASSNKISDIKFLSQELAEKEKELKGFMEKYTAQKYTKDGYPNANFVTQWVAELLKFKMAEAELRVVSEFKEELDYRYTHYSPIGSVLKRKERSISFSEQSYLSILSSLNTARLRLKSLEMNSATLKMINTPTYPLNSLPNNRKLIVAGVYFGTIAFMLGILLIVELFDRTLRDKMRTERITKGKVIGAFPKLSRSKNQDQIEQRSIHSLANRLYGFYKVDRDLNFINIIKFSFSVDVRHITELLAQNWNAIGLNVNAYYEGQDFDTQSRSYLVDQPWMDQAREADLALIQHGSMATSPIPSIFLEVGMVNLLVLRSDSVWKTEDEVMFDDLLRRSAGTPILICLTNAEKYVVEEFTGMLPPFTFLRRLEYQLGHFGLTSWSK